MGLILGLLALSFVLLMTSLGLIFLYVPTEAMMGVVQRIFYFHVPAAWNALLGYIIVFVGSIGYLWKRDSRWDDIASCSANVGLVFTTLFLVSGSIWAKPIWGVWWTWDPRLTTALILWFIYVAYHLVRAYAPEESLGARFGAVVGIVGMVDVPIIALANTLWRAQHPGALVFQGGLEPSMMLTLLVSVAAFTALYFLLLAVRVSLKHDEDTVRRLRESLQDTGD